MNDFVAVEMSQTAEDFSANEGDPVLLQRIPFRGFYEVSHGTVTAKLHHQPQLVVLTRGP